VKCSDSYRKVAIQNTLAGNACVLSGKVIELLWTARPCQYGVTSAKVAP